MIKNLNNTEGLSFLEDLKKNESTQNMTKKISQELSQNLSENNSFSKLYKKKRFSINSAISISNVSIKRRDSLFITYPELVSEFGNLDKIDLKMLMTAIIKNLLYIDIFCVCTNILVVTWLYFDHFDYIYNDYKISDHSNIYRITCIILSVIVCIVLIYRSIQKYKMKNLKFLLSMRSTVAKKKFNYKKLCFELFIHILQPYPNINYHWEMKILGNTVQYSLNMIFFFLCIIRIYSIIKILKLWSMFANEKAKRIFKFFGNKNIDIFFFKTNIKYYGFASVGVIFALIIYIFALFFKVCENYNKKDVYGFNYLFNSLWYLIQTMTTIGYGDYVPKTMIGRIIGVLACLVGIFLLSLITVTLMVLITIDGENELRAFNSIEILHTKNSKNNYYSKYFDTYLKYKLNKLRKPKYTTNKLDEFFLLKHQYKIQHEKNFLKIRSKTKENLTIPQFCSNVKEEWNMFFDDTKESIYEIINKIYPKQESLTNNIFGFSKAMKNSKLNSFRMVNLFKLMELLDSPFPIGSLKELKGENIVSYKDFKNRLKEFHLRYRQNESENSDLSFNIQKKKVFRMRKKKKSKFYLTATEKKEYYEDDTGSSFVDDESRIIED